MSRIERDLRAALKATGFDIKATALRLGVSRPTIYSRMAQFEIESPLSQREKMARAGSIGGSRTQENLTAAERSARARDLARARWARERGAA